MKSPISNEIRANLGRVLNSHNFELWGKFFCFSHTLLWYYFSFAPEFLLLLALLHFIRAISKKTGRSESWYLALAPVIVIVEIFHLVLLIVDCCVRLTAVTAAGRLENTLRADDVLQRRANKEFVMLCPEACY
jgi:hypothetical protein